MDIFLYIIGIIIALVALLGTLVITVLCYLNYCSKHPMRKGRAEIFVVLFVCLLSLVIRMAIGFTTLPHDAPVSGAESFLYGLLSTVAGLMFDAPMDLSNFELVNGILVCLYYGLIAYAGFVFLSVITVGLSYDFYSRVQTSLMRFRKHCTYYIFTSITSDSLVLADDIKKREQKQKGHSYIIIFFENGEESFSRKNPLHRKIMEQGFFYFSEPRCTDSGETISFLKRFKFKRKNCIKDDVGENHNKLFYVFALDDSGDYEGNNADIIFDDMDAALKAYVYDKNGIAYNGLPTVLNYYLLTNGEVNYESYDRRTDEILTARTKNLNRDFYFDGDPKQKPKSLKDYVDSQIQINVVNEATLSSYSLVNARNAHLDGLGDNAFSLDSAPDKDGTYRVAIIGFGKNGQYAMEELYTHTARLTRTESGYEPTQFIADIYDANMDEKSGMFAYNHPLFRCIEDDGSIPSDSAGIIKKAETVNGKAFDILYSEYAERSGKKHAAAKAFIDSKMAFPIAVMHKENSFKYPFLSSGGAETAIAAACENGVRDFVIALGRDERNIAMANMIIDSFRRMLLEASLAGRKLDLPHITIYVSLIESRNRALINWRWEDDAELYSHPYKTNDGGLCDSPQLSVISYGAREEMYSYSTIIEDYRERIYNFGYNLLSAILEADAESKEEKRKIYDTFKKRLNADYNAYRNDETVTDKWMTVSQFMRLSNKSALAFSINYYKYKQARGGTLTDGDWEYLIRLEHERWNRFFISHGWVYAVYYKHTDFTGMSPDEKKKKKDKEKKLMRGARQHNCLCPFDEMLDDYTKDYDRGNVELGFVKGIAITD